jgi:flagellar biosynthesis/type III secretory pathway protein FliH
MPQWRDFLERFRPAGSPGAAAQGGVPADRIGDSAAELAPVFMMLDDVRSQATRVRRCAIEQAEIIRRDAGRRAAEIATAAESQAQMARAAEFERARKLTAAEGTRSATERTRELDELRARVEARMPDYIDRVLAAVATLLEDFCQPLDAANDSAVTR